MIIDWSKELLYKITRKATQTTKEWIQARGVSQGNDFELIPTVKMETRHPIKGSFGSEFLAIRNHCGVMAVWSLIIHCTKVDKSKVSLFIVFLLYMYLYLYWLSRIFSNSAVQLFSCKYVTIKLSWVELKTSKSAVKWIQYSAEA